MHYVRDMLHYICQILVFHRGRKGLILWVLIHKVLGILFTPVLDLCYQLCHNVIHRKKWNAVHYNFYDILTTVPLVSMTTWGFVDVSLRLLEDTSETIASQPTAQHIETSSPLLCMLPHSVA